MNRLAAFGVLWLVTTMAAADSHPWPGGVVRYRLDATVGPYREALEEALGLWRAALPSLVFHEVPDSWGAGWAWFFGLDRSVTVRVDRSLAVFGRTSLGAVARSELVFNPELSTPQWLQADLAHEWGHVLGLTHEHQRRDRDRYIAFPPGFLETLPPERRPDYALLPDDPPAGSHRPYDYSSLLHYSSNIDGNRLVRRDTGAYLTAARVPSPGDRYRLAVLYSRPEETP